MSGDTELQLLQMRARIASLEAALRRRSEELRHIQQRLPPSSVAIIEQVMAELAPGRVTAYAVEAWRETFLAVPALVEPVLEDLWRSLRRPPGDPQP